MNTLGSRIRALRMQMGLRQGDLAQGICTPSMISQIENGNAHPSPYNLLMIAERLDLHVSQLLDSIELNSGTKSKFALAKALREAGEHRMALALLEDVQQEDQSFLPVLDFQYQLSMCYIQTAQWHKALTALDTLMESAVVRGDRQMIIVAFLAQGEVAARQKSYPIAIHQTERARTEYQKLAEEIPYLAAKILAQLVRLYEQIGLVQESVTYGHELLRIYEKMSDPAQAAHIYLSLAKSCQARGEYGQSREYASHALTLFQHLNHQQAVCDLHVQVLLLTCEEANWTSTVQQVSAIAVALEEQGGKRERAGAIFAALSAVCLRFNSLEQAEMFAEDAVQILPEKHMDAGVAHRTLGLLRLAENEMERAQEQFDRAVTIFIEHGMDAELEETSRKMTDALGQMGRYKESFEHLRVCHDYFMQQMGERGILF